MSRSAFLFFKGLGLLFALLVGVGTAVLGWYDAADWINIVFYSVATSALVLWGWHHFSIRWIHSDLQQNIFSQVSTKENIETKELAASPYRRSNFFNNEANLLSSNMSLTIQNGLTNFDPSKKQLVVKRHLK